MVLAALLPTCMLAVCCWLVYCSLALMTVRIPIPGFALGCEVGLLSHGSICSLLWTKGLLCIAITAPSGARLTDIVKGAPVCEAAVLAIDRRRRDASAASLVVVR